MMSSDFSSQSVASLYVSCRSLMLSRGSTAELKQQPQSGGLTGLFFNPLLILLHSMLCAVKAGMQRTMSAMVVWSSVASTSVFELFSFRGHSKTARLNAQGSIEYLNASHGKLRDLIVNCDHMDRHGRS